MNKITNYINFCLNVLCNLSFCCFFAATSQAADVFNDPYFSQQLHLHEWNLQETWKLGDGTGVTVAIIDNGFWEDEPDTKNKYLSDQYILNGDNVYHSNSIVGMTHGTSVAATIAAEPNNNIGFVGIAPGVKLLAYFYRC